MHPSHRAQALPVAHTFQTNGHSEYDYSNAPPPNIPRHTMLPNPSGHLHQRTHTPPLQQTSQRGDHIFRLVVEQQPDRARMCGFGDKDRRPITPPPCVKLVVTDAKTGQEVDADQIDSQHFVLNVDLWSSDAFNEVNLVKHSNTSPSVSISMATTTSYPPPPEPMMIMTGPQGGMPRYQGQGPMDGNGNYYPMQLGQQPQAGYGYPQPVPVALPQAGANAGMYTRNLIGSVTVSASVLEDLNNKIGFWFVLQDLSVRTEGNFRLKMSFIDVGGPNNALNTGRCPVLASVFSDVFNVWSAKKFPGVKESTPLSKCFATQGVKIPIRKTDTLPRGLPSPQGKCGDSPVGNVPVKNKKVEILEAEEEYCREIVDWPWFVLDGEVIMQSIE